MKLSNRSRRMLQGVHPDLVRVVDTAVVLATAADIDFGVLEGLRTLKRQQQLVAAGASHSLHSRHLTGHAVDLGAYIPVEDEDGDGIDDDGIFGYRWDWPLYNRLAEVVKLAADGIGVPLEWGGDWPTFKDGPHFQLPKDKYPEVV